MLKRVVLAVAALAAVAALEGCGSASPNGSQAAASVMPEVAASSSASGAGGAGAVPATGGPDPSPTGAATPPSATPPSATPVDLDCDTALTAVWPREAEVPSAPAWDGPRCVDGDGVELTWLSVAGDATPESADAAFVELQSGFKRSGWTLSDPRSQVDQNSSGGAKVVVCEIASPDGAVTGEMAYQPMDVGRAMLEVSFRR